MSSPQITQESVEAYIGRLVKYLSRECPFDKFGQETYLLDLLYLMGDAIDGEEYHAADGFDRFKARLIELLGNHPPVNLEKTI